MKRPDDRMDERASLLRLKKLLRQRAGKSPWSEGDLLEFPRLYRMACSIVARHAADGRQPQLAQDAQLTLDRAHAVLFRHRHRQGERKLLRSAWHLFWVESPRAIRAEWRLLGASFAFEYGVALIAAIAVAKNLDLAPSLLSPGMVEAEIQQLAETASGEPFRGNFNFGLEESSQTAGMIMSHNIGVGLLFFATALIPPCYVLLLGLNALMLGTYIAVAWHWGQAGSISSVLWCHGVIEIQAFVLAGTAGLVLVRAWVLPGRWSRRYAMQVESRRALKLFAPVFPMLFVAGLIEGFVTPHAPFAVRIATAIGTGILLVAWVLCCGRQRSETPNPG